MQRTVSRFYLKRGIYLPAAVVTGVFFISNTCHALVEGAVCAHWMQPYDSIITEAALGIATPLACPFARLNPSLAHGGTITERLLRLVRLQTFLRPQTMLLHVDGVLEYPLLPLHCLCKIADFGARGGVSVERIR